MPSGEREAIFEAFYQGQAPEGMRAGYGLGLALARTAARAHGGEIEVGDAAAGGAAFIVRLPRLKVADGARAPAAPAAPSRGVASRVSGGNDLAPGPSRSDQVLR